MHSCDSVDKVLAVVDCNIRVVVVVAKLSVGSPLVTVYDGSWSHKTLEDQGSCMKVRHQLYVADLQCG